MIFKISHSNIGFPRRSIMLFAVCPHEESAAPGKGTALSSWSYQAQFATASRKNCAQPGTVRS